MKQKIGILTHYFNCTNYGGLLQAYALTKFLTNHGYYAEQIRYNFEDCETFDKENMKSLKSVEQITPEIDSKNVVVNKFKFLFEAIRSKVVYSYIRPYRRKKKQKELDRIFKKRRLLTKEFEIMIPHSEGEYDRNNINSVEAEYNIYITGSDQVWNFKWFHSAFFLEFVSDYKKKIAYAASAGKSEFDKQENSYLQRVLPRFDAISVREDDLVTKFNCFFSEEKTLFVVDPVFLITKEEWNSLMAPRMLSQKYLFCYLLDFDEEQWKLANQVAKENKLQLVSIPCSAGWYYEEDKKLMGKQLEGIGPKEFLSLIRYADYIFTNSFHATAFSIIFNKHFVVLDRKNRKGMGSRVKTLTSLFGCVHQFCDNDQNLDYINTVSFTDFQNYPERAQQKINDSQNFLLKALVD